MSTFLNSIKLRSQLPGLQTLKLLFLFYGPISCPFPLASPWTNTKNSFKSCKPKKKSWERSWILWGKSKQKSWLIRKQVTLTFSWLCNPSVCTTDKVQINYPPVHFASGDSTQVVYNPQLNKCHLGSCWSLVGMLGNRGRSLEGRRGHSMLCSTYCVPAHGLAGVGLHTRPLPERLPLGSHVGCVALLGLCQVECPPRRKFSQGQGSLFSLPLQWIYSINCFVLPSGRKCSLSFHTWASLMQALSQEPWLNLKTQNQKQTYFKHVSFVFS